MHEPALQFAERRVAGGRRLRLGEVCSAIGARLSTREGDADLPLGRVVIDSRDVQPGDLFWALRGSHADGADFASDAWERGAVAMVTHRRGLTPPVARHVLEVEDTAAALVRLAEWRRRRFGGRVIAVAGSAGKTATRQMIHAVLGARLPGTTSPRNDNNHLGVPLSMVGWDRDHAYAVVEIGASQAGEIGELARLVRPDIGIVTNAGDAHLGRLGGEDDVLAAKCELLPELSVHGFALVNGDDQRLRRRAAECSASIMTFGRSADCDWRASNIRSRDGELRFDVDGETLAVRVWGRHHLGAALAAVALGRLSGFTWDEVRSGLARFEPEPMRCQMRSVGAARVIDDAYNASPAAMIAAFDLLAETPADGERVAVCGDMAELGEHAERLHRRLGGQVVTRAAADRLIACGEHAEALAAGARDAGMPHNRIATFTAPDAAASDVRQCVRDGSVILIKGSRGQALERLVDMLDESPDQGGAETNYGTSRSAPAPVTSHTK